MAATLSSLWGRAQSNKRPLPGQAGGCVDLTAEDDAAKSQVSGKVHSPDRANIDLADASSYTEVQQAIELGQNTKRRRLDTTAMAQQVCVTPSSTIMALLGSTFLYLMLCRQKTASPVLQGHILCLPVSNRLKV